MKIKTNIKAGALDTNHNQTAGRSLKVKSNVKAGRCDDPSTRNHNQTVVRSLKIKSSVKAGEGYIGSNPARRWPFADKSSKDS
jgi:hypothetical protein